MTIQRQFCDCSDTYNAFTLGFSREQAKKMQSMIAHVKLARWMVNAGALPGSDQGAMVSLNDQLLGPEEQNWKK